MDGLSRKIYLELKEPSREDAASSQERILRALRADYGDVYMPCRILRMLYPICEEADWRLTVSLGWNGGRWEVIKMEKGDTSAAHYGMCADLGSTTVAVQMIDLCTGEILASSSVYNRQTALGGDILTRIFYTKDHPEHLDEIRQATIDTFTDAFADLQRQTGIPPEACTAMTVAGNMTMIHFLIGMDPFGVFSAPYAVRADRPDFLPAEELGFPFHGYVYCYPGRANYLGGDIISGIIASGIARKEEICVFLDIGTNGELVVGNREFLLCGAGAAGPALEGGSVKTGMCARTGAVQHVRMDGRQFIYDVIGGGEANGICGSGIVDLIAELFLHGWVDIRGRFVPEASDRIVEREGEYAVEYAPSLYFYQCDLDEFLSTKAAAATMVEYMMNLIGLSMQDVGEFQVAGAFGAYIDKESAVAIGLYPDLDRSRLISAGNTSLKGAYEMLLHKEYLAEAADILDRMEYVQFGEVEDFIQLMGAARALPHTDLSRYPSVVEKLRKNGIPGV